MKNRLEKIYNIEHPHNNKIDFSKLKVGLKVLDDAVIIENNFSKANKNFGDKKYILNAISKGDLDLLRDISCFYEKTSGIYNRLIKHLSNFYRYDWILTPYNNSQKKENEEKILNTFYKILFYLDNSSIKKFFNDAAKKVVKNGAYYGYRIESKNGFVVQELNPKYCRSLYSINNRPVVEFQMKFFDDTYKNEELRYRILKNYPADFLEGYKKYQAGKLPPQTPNDTPGWFLLNTNNAFKFSITDNDQPLFISVIPHIIDLDEAQELDRKKMAQKLLKILIQKLPMDKNGDTIFDSDEVRELHNQAVHMLGKAIGVDILTTYADVEVANVSDPTGVTSVDELEKIERAVYNESGTAQNLFNTDGNLALEKSLLDDEASLVNLILQFEIFLNDAIQNFNKRKDYSFRINILPTTVYNYKELSKLYKEQATMGYSKMLPQVALGLSQSMILATAVFENQVLNLSSVLIPLLSSNTMSSADLTEKSVGRQEKPDDQKSEKTLANEESLS